MRQSKSGHFSSLCHVALSTVVLLALIAFLPRNGAAQGTSTAQPPSDVAYRDATFSCLSKSQYIWEPTFGNWVERGSGGIIVSTNVVGDAVESVRQDPVDPNTAYDTTRGKNYFWDKDKGSWGDGKTGECICPKCAPETTTTTPPSPQAPPSPPREP